VTGLRGTSAREYEFFTPSTADFLDHLGDPANPGVPGQDPFPRLDSAGQLQTVEGERLLGEWEARALTRGLMHRTGTPDDWAVADGEWLREELASRGRVKIVLTNLRLLVAIPQTHLNRQTYEVVIRPVRKRGEGPAVPPNLKDRAMLGAMARLGRGSGPLGQFSRDLIGDLPPVAGHLAHETIRSVTWPAPGRRGPVVVQSVVRATGRSVAVGQSREKFLALELDIGRQGTAELGRRLAEAIRTCWEGAGLAGDVPPGVGEGPVADAAGELRYEPPRFRPIGSAHATAADPAGTAEPGDRLERTDQDASDPDALLVGKPDAAAPSSPERAAMSTPAFCGSCGHRIESAARFCSACGVDQREFDTGTPRGRGAASAGP
jgi:hypothetical protein